ncbi:MAG TPA: DUF1501 domain-containing protein [Thermoanaerobaculaceae bacterium]|nr:DUF1501 domain-containing protein [Thermoanaerobaculaceae bacterium]
MRNRRQLLFDFGFGLAASAILSRFRWLGRLEAAVAGAPADYRALVCLFLFGGNDGNNTVIPYDGYGDYDAVRGGSLAIAKDSLLRIDAPSAGAAFGLHPALPEIQSLYNAGHAAVLANVGTLTQPLTRSQYLAGAPRPDNLFSHADQQAQWQSSVVSAVDRLAQTGWGGRTADAAAALAGGTFPMIVSVAGVPLFTTGENARPLVPGGGLAGFRGDAVSNARYAGLRQILTLDTGLTLVGADSGITSTAIDNIATLNAALATAPTLATAFPSTSLGKQLQVIARIISVRAQLGMSRQIFFASLTGFDTHTDEINTQQTLLAEVSQAVSAFYASTVELGVAPSVTTFTLSDFGRTLLPASGGGTDHAWGNHHLVVGGAVRGGDFFGTYPTVALSGPDDASDEGRWIPTTSVDQYGATLAGWFGLGSAALATVFPNLGRFASPDLGFLG